MMEERYYKFSQYLRRQFGIRVHKISVNAGFSCPNKDGKISKDGCIYCDNRSFNIDERWSQRSIETQIKEGINLAKSRFKAKKFIIYFQPHTNTYGPLDLLKERYDIVRRFEDVVGISIGTRPDCIDENVLELINSYTEDYDVWIEYGLQSIHNKTLKLINRGHLYEDFLKAVLLTRKYPRIKICAHVIIGLLYETEEMILETAKVVGNLKIDGVKIHPLHIIKGTKLEEMFLQGLCRALTLSEYIDLAIRFLEYLWPGTIIQRISADCPAELLVAPLWILEKNRVLEGIEKKLVAEDRYQGSRYTSWGHL